MGCAWAPRRVPEIVRRSPPGQTSKVGFLAVITPNVARGRENASPRAASGQRTERTLWQIARQSRGRASD